MALITVAAVVVGAVFIGAVVLMQNRPSGDGSLPFGLVAPADAIPAAITVDGQTMGAAAAPVTLEVYSDFQCPACRTFAEDTEPLLRETYVVPGTLKIVYKDAAFQGAGGSDPSYDESVESAAAARCAGQQGEFWTYHDWLFANWDGENQGAFRDERLKAIADAIGLDRATWDACRASGTEQAAVKASTTAAVATGVSVTPTLYVNGQKIEGAATYTQLAPVIDAAAAAASPAPSGSAGASASPSTAPSASPSVSPSP
jgi:protein-disulfide isomerase